MVMITMDTGNKPLCPYLYRLFQISRFKFVFLWGAVICTSYLDRPCFGDISLLVMIAHFPPSHFWNSINDRSSDWVFVSNARVVPRLICPQWVTAPNEGGWCGRGALSRHEEPKYSSILSDCFNFNRSLSFFCWRNIVPILMQTKWRKWNPRRMWESLQYERVQYRRLTLIVSFLHLGHWYVSEDKGRKEAPPKTWLFASDNWLPGIFRTRSPERI